MRKRMAYVSFNTGIVHHFVNMIGNDSRLDLARSYVQDFSRHAAHLAHGILLLLI